MVSNCVGKSRIVVSGLYQRSLKAKRYVKGFIVEPTCLVDVVEFT
jgi:hypothetical protein